MLRAFAALAEDQSLHLSGGLQLPKNLAQGDSMSFSSPQRYPHIPAHTLSFMHT